MRNRSYVFNHVNFEACSLQGADSGFTTGSRTFNHNFDALHAMFHSCFCSRFRCHLSGERSGFTGTFESKAAGACPGNCVAVRIRNCNDRIVEGGADMCHTSFNIFAVTTFSTYDFFGLAIVCYPPSYFFLFATVRRGPLRVRAFVLVRCPRTGNPRR